VWFQEYDSEGASSDSTDIENSRLRLLHIRVTACYDLEFVTIVYIAAESEGKAVEAL
jgi:hypothetical protein